MSWCMGGCLCCAIMPAAATVDNIIASRTLIIVIVILIFTFHMLPENNMTNCCGNDNWDDTWINNQFLDWCNSSNIRRASNLQSVIYGQWSGRRLENRPAASNIHIRECPYRSSNFAIPKNVFKNEWKNNKLIDWKNDWTTNDWKLLIYGQSLIRAPRRRTGMHVLEELR
jgi:hypothetical protein